MAIKELSDGNPDGTRLGQSSTDLVGFFGTTVAAQPTLTTLATAATIATIRTSVQQIIAALRTLGLGG